MPTARLERAFTEHVDCCAYRLDAWRTGLAASRLAELRKPVGAAPAQGLYLGAFGWLENARPRAHAGAPVAVSADLAGTFQRPGDAPLVSDPASSGYVHAPSLSQAAAAAVLRTAYDIHANPSTPEAMAVDLSSTRVRQALEILEGVRTGQPLSALLGYRFERGLHDAHGLAEIDTVIYPLRQAFPLVANQLASTRTDGTVDIALLEARNVIDGVALVTRMATDGAAYPFGLPTGNAPGQLPAVTADQASAIDAEAARLRDLYDAIGDLALAEGVYQVVLGIFDRAAAVATTFGSGGHPPSIQVVDTPQSGLTLTHRVALHLDASADPGSSPTAVPMTPRARADAALNAWLSGRLPAPDAVVVQVSYAVPESLAPIAVVLSLADLGFQAIDLLAITGLDLDDTQGSMTEFDDRIVQAIRYGGGLGAHPDVSIAVDYEQPVAGKISLFELAALLRELRTVILGSRALGSTDVAARPVDASAAWDIVNLGARVTAATAGLTTVRDALATAAASSGTLDDLVLVGTTALLDAARYGVPQTGTSQVHRDVRAIYDAVVAKVRAVVARWTQRTADYTALFASWNALTSNADRTALVAQAERLVAPQTTAQPPADPAAYRAAVDAVAAQLTATTTQLSALLAWSGARLVDFAAAVVALVLSVAQHDDTPLDLAAEQTAIDATRARLATRLAAVAADVTARIADATTALAAAMASTDASQAAVAALQAAGRRVLGGEAMLVPHFTLSAADGAAFAQALAGSDALLVDLRTAGRRFPVDDWMYGVARVRSKLHAWEASTVLAELLGAPPAELVPTQLPLVANDRWQALEFDVSTTPQTDRLLYTAHLASPFDAAAAQCGLLLDEWHEVVPATELVSGLAVHVERPRSQPPQAMLLAVPPVVRGVWQWSDLVATVLETLDAVKSRAVEPAQIDATGYAQILPATLIATTLYQVTIATNLGINNDVYARLEKA